MAIIATSRVYHLADRNKTGTDKRIGTVQRLYTKNGTAYAKVKWDGAPEPVSHPVANLVEKV